MTVQVGVAVTVVVVVAVGDFSILEISQMKEIIVGTATATTSN